MLTTLKISVVFHWPSELSLFWTHALTHRIKWLIWALCIVCVQGHSLLLSFLFSFWWIWSVLTFPSIDSILYTLHELSHFLALHQVWQIFYTTNLCCLLNFILGLALEGFVEFRAHPRQPNNGVQYRKLFLHLFCNLLLVLNDLLFDLDFLQEWFVELLKHLF